MATCCNVMDRKLFQCWSTVHVDWRWEFLGPALTAVDKVIRHIQVHFRSDLLNESETGANSKIKISELEKLIPFLDAWVVQSEMFKVLSFFD